MLRLDATFPKRFERFGRFPWLFERLEILVEGVRVDVDVGIFEVLEQ